MKGKVFVKKKPGVLDPEGATIQKALLNLGYRQVGSVQSGRVFEVELETQNPARAEEELREMARKLLANPVIEDFRVELEVGGGSRAGENGSGPAEKPRSRQARLPARHAGKRNRKPKSKGRK